MSTAETEQSITPRVLMAGLAMAAGTAGGALLHQESAHAAMEPAAIEAEAPHTITVTVQPGQSPYGLMDKYTDLTPQQIVDDLPRFYDLNHRTMLHPGESAVVPTSPNIISAPSAVADTTQAVPVIEGTYQLHYGDALWTVVRSHYGFVTPELVQAVATASDFPDMEHYLSGQTVKFPNLEQLNIEKPTSVATHTAPATSPPASTPAPQPTKPNTPTQTGPRPRLFQTTAPAATTTTTTPAQPTPAPTPAPAETTTTPTVTKETATWKAQSGKAVLGTIAVISAQKNVPPATVAGWIRDANPSLNLAKLKDGQTVVLPGVTKQEFSDYGKNIEHFARVVKKNPQVMQNFAEADRQEYPRPPYTIETNPLSKSGVTAQQIDEFLAEHAPAMAGLGKAFKQIEDQYGINAIYAVAHAGNESSWGTSNIARAKNNLFGRNAYDTSPMASALTNNSYEASVLEYGAFLKNAYLTEPGQPGVPGQREKPGAYFRGFSLKGVFDLYSTGLNHDQTIANLMSQIDPQIRAEK